MASKNYSIVEYFSENDGHACGYCKSKTTNFSHGMWAYQMTVQDYQDLIDRGWRRSGHYCYKPTMHKICCPMYTIRCNALQFKISKSQKKLLKRMNRYLSHGERGKQRSTDKETDESAHSEGDGVNPDMLEAQHATRSSVQGASRVSRVNPSLQHLIAPNSAVTEDSKTQETCAYQGPSQPTSIPTGEGTTESIACSSVGNLSEHSKLPKPGQGADKGRPPCKKAKLIRLERRQQKLASRGLVSNSSEQMSKQENATKSLEDFLHADLPESSAHRLQVRLVRSQPASADFKNTFEDSFRVFRLYQMTIHGDPESKCTEAQYKRFIVKSPLELKLVARGSREFITTFNQSWCLYAKYQKAIHKDMDSECDRQTFMDFLVETPLKAWHPADGSGPPQGYGSFHQQYWLDDRLIAVGVIDILPRCVSSVYFYYDPEFSDLSLGTYGSLREVSFSRALHHSTPDLQWYYMGFYIHSCPKMRYKAALSPSFLLCPEAFTWHPIEQCRTLLDRVKYSRLEPDPNRKDLDAPQQLGKILVLFDQCAMEYSQYEVLRKKKDQSEDEVALQYAQLVGNKCARRMLLLR